MHTRPPSRCRTPALAAALLVAWSSHVAAAESASAEEPVRLVVTGGDGQEVAVYGVGVLWPIPVAVDTLARHGLDVRLGADILRWDGPKSGVTNEFLWDAGLTPYLRWRPADGPWHGFHAEAGIGVHLLSHTAINPSREFSTAFQFGERFALGIEFGPRNRYELSVFVQHVSNADIRKPNLGLTYVGATIGMPFD